jgi:hypothetical protein
VLPVIVAFVISAAPLSVARGDTDYRCLNACIGKGGVGTTCLEQCRTQTDQAPSSSPPSSFTHNVLVTPQPALNELLVLPNRQPAQTIETGAKAPAPRTDYLCIRDCLQEGLTDNVCRRLCTR